MRADIGKARADNSQENSITFKFNAKKAEISKLKSPFDNLNLYLLMAIILELSRFGFGED